MAHGVRPGDRGLEPVAAGMADAALGDSASHRTMAPADRSPRQPRPGRAGGHRRDPRALQRLGAGAGDDRRGAARPPAARGAAPAQGQRGGVGAFAAGVRAAFRATAHRRRGPRGAPRQRRAHLRGRHRGAAQRQPRRGRRHRLVLLAARSRRAQRPPALDRRAAWRRRARAGQRRPGAAQRPAPPRPAPGRHAARRLGRALHTAGPLHTVAARRQRRLAALERHPARGPAAHRRGRVASPCHVALRGHRGRGRGAGLDRRAPRRAGGGHRRSGLARGRLALGCKRPALGRGAVARPRQRRTQRGPTAPGRRGPELHHRRRRGLAAQRAHAGAAPGPRQRGPGHVVRRRRVQCRPPRPRRDGADGRARATGSSTAQGAGRVGADRPGQCPDGTLGRCTRCADALPGQSRRHGPEHRRRALARARRCRPPRLAQCRARARRQRGRRYRAAGARQGRLDPARRVRATRGGLRQSVDPTRLAHPFRGHDRRAAGPRADPHRHPLCQPRRPGRVGPGALADGSRCRCRRGRGRGRKQCIRPRRTTAGPARAGRQPVAWPRRGGGPLPAAGCGRSSPALCSTGGGRWQGGRRELQGQGRPVGLSVCRRCRHRSGRRRRVPRHRAGRRRDPGLRAG